MSEVSSVAGATLETAQSPRLYYPSSLRCIHGFCPRSAPDSTIGSSLRQRFRLLLALARASANRAMFWTFSHNAFSIAGQAPSQALAGQRATWFLLAT